MEKWQILELGQEIYRVSLEHLTVSEIQEMLYTHARTHAHARTRRCQMGVQRHMGAK